jgi:hypothetical protein
MRAMYKSVRRVGITERFCYNMIMNCMHGNRRRTQLFGE